MLDTPWYSRDPAYPGRLRDGQRAATQDEVPVIGADGVCAAPPPFLPYCLHTCAAPRRLSG
jgi:hypothetical protein